MNEKELAEARWRARTDLYFLGNEVLGYDFVEEVHRPVCEFFVKKDPNKPFEEQDIIHDRLLLDPREHYKTTIDVCDIVQWILCFKNIRIAVFSATERLAKQILAMASRHFYYNDVLRQLFPEYCYKSSEEPGIFEFTVPNRDRWFREPTISISTIESASVGGHYEILKFDDIVGNHNVRTADAIQKVKDSVADLKPLVMAGGYRDFIGTRYDISDAYGEIADRLEDVPKLVEKIPFGKIVTASGETEQWKIFDRQFSTMPLTRESKYLFPVTKNGRPNFTFARAMKTLKEMGPYRFGCQYVNDPTWGATNSFGKELMERILIPMQHIPFKYSQPLTGQEFIGVRGFITIDPAFSEERQADFTAIAFGVYDRLGKLYVADFDMGRWTADEFILHILGMIRKWNPLVARIGIEKAGGVELIVPSLRAAGMHGVLGKIDWIKLTPKRNKWEKVLGLLPMAKNGKFFINKDMPQINQLVKQFIGFPKGKVDGPDAISMLLDYQSAIDNWHPQQYNQMLESAQRTYQPNPLGFGLNGGI